MAAPPPVILLHGLWMNRHVMAPLAAAIRRAGFGATGWSYASTGLDLDDNAALLLRRIAAMAAVEVHLVAHSYGGIVALAAATAHAASAAPRIGRIVLLGSPVGGCAAGSSAARNGRWRRILGKSARVWEEGLPVAVPAGLEVGSIAGTSRLSLSGAVTNHRVPNDGLIRVDETRIPGLADHLALPTSHSTMLVSPMVARQVVHFLREGRFAR